ncbi:hypothetical protein [Actinacidiphila yeochonensis]|uniref:hypothetical protein n=1 Tax=Actinacidiphila yeochonensis TaxID=89050 RepID=UPI00056C34ED|nr:hypothetical protein [Actinacidiphila yeochonensis]
MAEELKTTSQLGRLFADYTTLADLVADAGKQIDDINTLNEKAGGTDDEVAQQYLEKAKPGGQALTDLVTLLKTLSLQTGDNGETANALFNQAEDESTALANEWPPS